MKGHLEWNVLVRWASLRRVAIAVAALWTTYLAILFLSNLRPTQRVPSFLLPSTMWRSVLIPVSAAVGLVAGSSSATRLYVSSYAGTITVLDLDLENGSGLRAIANTTACGMQPSWLTLDYANSYVYCLDEAWSSPTGAVTSFYANEDGSLTALGSAELIAGPVSIAKFGEGGSGLAIASYAGSGVNVVAVGSEGGVELVQNETYTLSQPGPIADRQEAPHPHEALLDPTAEFILVPDLGADLVRVYQADASTFELTPIEPLEVSPGAGPRHGAFVTAQDKTYFYLVTELGNTIIGYDVQYNADKTLGFSELFTIPTHADNRTLATTAAASEVVVTPDEKFLIVSSRWEYSLSIPNFDPSNSTEIVSDPLIVYEIDNQTGSLTKIQEFAAGGSGPRHFSINGDGDRLAVGLQGDGRVVIIERDVQTGLLKDFLASADVAGEVTSAVFYEDN
ncbi:Lactonase, 7-bladed beta-propeller-domain-containing protein [Xylaria intraflava]|nr:Lactonase, 7-bladed beta-propeller-domain-containing protein [Xylaria intraflava]